MESLKSQKFEAFKGNAFTETINVTGGKIYSTRNVGGTASDVWDDTTSKDIRCTDGTTYDSCRAAAVWSRKLTNSRMIIPLRTILIAIAEKYDNGRHQSIMLYAPSTI